MMIRQFRKNVGRSLRIFPCPVSRTWRPHCQIAEESNTWRVENIDEQNRAINLSHYLGYRFNLGFDHVHSFFTPDILKLRSQIIIHGPRIVIEPR